MLVRAFVENGNENGSNANAGVEELDNYSRIEAESGSDSGPFARTMALQDHLFIENRWKHILPGDNDLTVISPFARTVIVQDHSSIKSSKAKDLPGDFEPTVICPFLKTMVLQKKSPVEDGRTQALANLIGSTMVEETVVEDLQEYFKPGEQERREPQYVGRVIDNKFKIIREISSGGMGVVYEAEHLSLKKRFAIKSILSKFTKDQNFHKRFDREAKTQALLQHDNIIQVTDFIRENGQFFMVMEYVEGKGLNTLIREKSISESDMLSIIKDVLKGLSHAHGKGIIHRDIKPSNIMITRDKTAKIMDFGIALLTGEEQCNLRGVMGTPSYMSPEQINHPASVDHRSDIYSTGIVMFEILCGKRPFDGKNVRDTKNNHIHQKLPEIEPVFPDCTSEITSIIVKSLEKNPSKRFSNADTFMESLISYERQTRLECRRCKSMNRVKNKYKLRGEKCINCGQILSMKSKFTKMWASAFVFSTVIIIIYLVYPWPGSLVVRTKPVNAQVFINGDQKGVTPLVMSVSPGIYEILVKKENMKVVRNVEIKKKETAALDIDIYKKLELKNLAYEAIKKAYQSASYISRDLNDLKVSEKNLEISKTLNDSALTDSYQQQISELEQNIGDGFQKYEDFFHELLAIKPDIRNVAYKEYNTSLHGRGGNLENLAVVWRHFERYLSDGMQEARWKSEIIRFSDNNTY